MSSPHFRAIVRGKVQGVYFRDTTRQTAERLGLTGSAVNLPDGTVRVEAYGPRPALEGLVEFLHRGSPQSRVDGVEIEWQDDETPPPRFTTG